MKKNGKMPEILTKSPSSSHINGTYLFRLNTLNLGIMVTSPGHIFGIPSDAFETGLSPGFPFLPFLFFISQPTCSLAVTLFFMQ